MTPATIHDEGARSIAHEALDALIDRMIERHIKGKPTTTISDLRAELHLFANDTHVLHAIGAEILTAASKRRTR
jgi:hypothetical protein